MGLFKLLGEIALAAIDKAPEVLYSMALEQEKTKARVLREQEKKFKEADKKLNNYEKNANSMSYEQQQKLKEARKTLNEKKATLDAAVKKQRNFEEKTRTSKWICLGKLKDANLTPYNHCVGIYRHVINGKTMYVGRAVELNNGGFRKRLSDYRRSSDSARKHTSGQKIYDNLDDIITYILVVGDTQDAIDETKRLEGYFIAKYNPPWNKMINI